MDRSEANYKRMTETKVSKLILSLGLPTTISMLITNIYNLADTYFVGTISTSAQAATSVLFTLQSIIQAISFMFGMGAGTYVSKFLADRDTKNASKFVSTAFYTGIILSTLLLIFGLIFIEPFVKLLGSTDTALYDSKEYGMWILLSAPFLVGSLIINNNLRYEGKAIYAMVGLVSGGLLNIFGDFVFITLCNMGTRGAGLSTCISQIISFIILIIMYIKFAQSSLNPKYISKDIKTYLLIIRAGFPSLIRQGLTSISHGVLNNICKPYGDDLTAAMGIVSRYSNFILCIGIGIGQGFQPVSAFNYQIMKYKRVKDGLIFTVLFSTICVALLSILCLIIPNQLIYVFNKDQEVIAYGAKALRLSTIGLIFCPICISANMLYQSIRKAEIASVLALLRSGIIFIPLIYILNPLMGIDGIMIAQPISHVISGIASIPFIIYFITSKKYKEQNEIIKNDIGD